MSSTNTNPGQLIPYVQAIYNQFEAINITPPLADIPFLIWNSSGSAAGDPLKFSTYCEDKLLALPAYANIVALGLTRNETLAMANLPDYEKIRIWLKNNPLVNQVPGHLVAVDLLQVVDNVVSLK